MDKLPRLMMTFAHGIIINFSKKGQHSNYQTEEYLSLSEHQEQVAKLEEKLKIMTTCWDKIPLLKCHSEGFKERLYEDRTKRVLAFTEALAKTEALDKKGDK